MMPADLLASAALLQVGYGASVLSFLGGIHWAMAMAEYGGAAGPSSRIADALLFCVPAQLPCVMDCILYCSTYCRKCINYAVWKHAW